MFLADASDAGSAAAVAASLVFTLIFVAVIFVVMMIPYYAIAKKAGYNGWLSLLMIVPLVNIVILYVFAFAEWPALRGGNAMFTGFATPPPPPFPQPGSGGPFGSAPMPPTPPPGSPFGGPPPPPSIGGPPTPWGS